MSYLRLTQSKTFLQKPIKIKMNELKIKCDPNTESSPPNTFMQNLHERMNNYYSPTNSPTNSPNNRLTKI